MIRVALVLLDDAPSRATGQIRRRLRFNWNCFLWRDLACQTFLRDSSFSSLLIYFASYIRADDRFSRSMKTMDSRVVRSIKAQRTRSECSVNEFIFRISRIIYSISRYYSLEIFLKRSSSHRIYSPKWHTVCPNCRKLDYKRFPLIFFQRMEFYCYFGRIDSEYLHVRFSI